MIPTAVLSNVLTILVEGIPEPPDWQKKGPAGAGQLPPYIRERTAYGITSHHAV